MVVNLSCFYGIPTKLSVAKRQFTRIKRDERESPFNRGRWLVLVKLKRGEYAGYYSTLLYETKPKVKAIKIYRFPKKRRK